MLESKTPVSQQDMMVLKKLVNELFKKEPPKKKPANGKAPFCKLGEDCFEGIFVYESLNSYIYLLCFLSLDVDHKRIAMDIKRLALALTSYLADRMKEEQQNQGVC